MRNGWGNALLLRCRFCAAVRLPRLRVFVFVCICLCLFAFVCVCLRLFVFAFVCFCLFVFVWGGDPRQTAVWEREEDDAIGLRQAL